MSKSLDYYDDEANMFGPARMGPQEKDSEELLKSLESTPLFMTSMDKVEDDNDTLAALQSLIYDGPPEEIALNFKNQGNEAFQDGPKHYKDAIEYYTKGLAVKADDPALNALLYSNRAAVNLELGNYRRTLNDCAESLKLNPKNVKAFFRSAKALFLLERYVEAMDCVERGLGLEPKNKSLLELKAKIVEKKAEQARKQAERMQKDKAKQEEEARLLKAFKERGLNLFWSNSLKNDDNEVDKPAPVSLPWKYQIPTFDESERMSFSVLFLYPEFSESDLISAFHEDSIFADHLDVMFGPEVPRPNWDKQGIYTPENIEIYFDARPDLVPLKNRGDASESTVRLLKVGPDLTLADVFAHPEYVLIDGVATFTILSKASLFAKAYKKERKKGQQQ